LHPERQYRLRRLTGAEILSGSALPPPFHTVWFVIRRESHQAKVVSYRRSAGLPCVDHDLELEKLFEQRGPANGGGSL
jgi:hypothetical protein